MDKNFYQKIGDNLKIDFVEGQGITVERIES